MRAHFSAIIILTLSAVAAELRAPQPAAAETVPCTVPADDTWTAPEQFVWARVCEGKVADFNADPAHGGNLDPRKVPLPDDRILSSAFVETILTQDKYLAAIKRNGLRVTGARFKETLDLQNLELASKLWLESCLFERGVDLSWTKTTQPVAFNNSKVRGELTFYAAHIVGDLHVTDSVIGRLLLPSAHVSRTVDLSRSHVTTELDMNGLEVAANLTMEGGEYAKVNLAGARVAHTLSLDKSTVTGGLQMDSLQVGLYLYLRNATLDVVNLLGARVQNQLSLEGSKVTRLNMFDLQVGTDLWMGNAEFFEPVTLHAQVGGVLRWNGTKFHGDVDLSGARVGELQLSTREGGSAKWDPNVTLTARYAKIGVIPRLSDAWPDKLRIFGLTYDGIADTGDDFRPWFHRQDLYSPQPYQQLANILQARGDIEQATQVRFAEREADRARPEHPWYVFAWLTLLKITIGYGYYPQLALVWVGFFVVLGALVLRISGEGAKNHMPLGLSYSFDMLLPFIRLRESNYRVEIANRWRYYFYFHRIMGWVLASFLVAGLSGLTK
jgi:hypothetical protein